MGLVFEYVVFDGRAPELARIVEKITEMTGLPLTVTESDEDIKGGLYDLHANLAFACAPKIKMTIHTYRAGEVREFSEQFSGDMDLPVRHRVTEMNEPEGTQAIHLTGYVGQEPTLMFATILALESLGGRPSHPIDDEERDLYGSPITPRELKARHRKLANQMGPVALVFLLMLPLLLPTCVIIAVVTAPWRVWRGYRRYQRHLERHGQSGHPNSELGSPSQ